MNALRITAVSALGTLVMTAFGLQPVMADTTTTTIVGTTGNTSSSSQPSVKLSTADAQKIIMKLFPNLMAKSPEISLTKNPFNPEQMVYQIMMPDLAFQNHGGPNINQNFTSAMIDANTGQLVRFSNGTNAWTLPQVITAAAAQKIAQTLLQKFAPDEMSEVAMEPTSGAVPGGFVYSYARKVNGILAPFDHIQLVLDASGSLVNYEIVWPNASFPSVPQNLLGQTTATNKFRASLNLQLGYQPLFTQPNTTALSLGYQPYLGPDAQFQNSAPFIDATTGDTLDPSGNVVPEPVSNPSLSPLGSGKVWPTRHTTSLTQSQVEAMARQQFGLSSTDWNVSSTLSSLQYGGAFSGQPQWQLNFNNASTNQQVQINVDATSGVITQYYNFSQTQQAQTQTQPTSAQLQKTADNFVKQVLPGLSGVIAEDPTTKQYGSSNVKFYAYDLLVYGIPVNNALTVQVDAATGQVQMYNLQVDPTQVFQNPNHALSQQAAEAAFIADDPVTLQYMLPMTNVAMNSGVSYGSTAKLVYANEPFATQSGPLDAFTGTITPITSFGLGLSLVAPANASAVDKAIAILKGHNVILPQDGPIDPTAYITRAQFVQWLSRAYGMNTSGNNQPQFPDVPSTNPYAADISEALMQGWLPYGQNFYPSQTLTRLQTAQFLSQWLGWSSFAANPTFFKLPFKDVTAVPNADLGAATIAIDDKMLSLVNGAFDPSGKMTIGEAAMALTAAASAYQSAEAQN